MKAGVRMWAALCSALLAASALAAQEAPPPGEPMMQSGAPELPVPLSDRVEILGFGGWRGGKVVTGAPFSALAVTETTQTLADGNKITRKTQASLFRDSQGRFRREVTLPAIGPLAAQGRPRSFVVIQDPVAGASYVLEPDRKIARQLPSDFGKGKGLLNQFLFRKMNPPTDVTIHRESLGFQTINGVNAEGIRLTRTIPAGQIGNEKPLTIVSESWYSPDLQIMVVMKRSDPRFGDTSYTVTNVQLSEPPATLFSVPADYTVKQGAPRKARKFMKRGQVPPPPPDGPGPGL